MQQEQSQPLPKDAKVIALILRSLGIEDFEPKVVHQLLEFAHRYTGDVFSDALVYCEHAGRTDINLDDVQLAIQGRVNHSFTTPPPKEFLLELAEEKNKVPLPIIPEKYGIRLPPEKYCLVGTNFQILPEAPPPPQPIIDKTHVGHSHSIATASTFPTHSTNSSTNVAGVDNLLISSQPTVPDLSEDDDYDMPEAQLSETASPAGSEKKEKD